MKNFIIAIPKIKKMVIPPVSKNIKYTQETIKIEIKEGLSTIALVIPNTFGVLEQDLLYTYLLILLNQHNKCNRNEINLTSIDPENLLKKSTIQIKIQDILKILKKSSGGSNYKQIYKSNLKLSQSIITWELYKSNNKTLIGASNLIDFNIDTKKLITAKINQFYIYYLLQPYRLYLNNYVDSYWSKYTLINLKERFTLKCELQKYIHTWLSYDIFPNNHVYTIKIEKIVNHIQDIHNISHINNDRWLRNTRYCVSQSIIQICNKLSNWYLIKSYGRGKQKINLIKRDIFIKQ